MTSSIENACTNLENTSAKNALNAGGFYSRLKKPPVAGIKVAKRGKKTRGQKRNALYIKIMSKSQRKGGKRVHQRKALQLINDKRKRNAATIYIQSTHNNTIYTLTNNNGETRNWVSAGRCGFKNTRKATSYASQAAAEKVTALAKNYNFQDVNIKMKGLGPGKLSGVRTLHQSGFKFLRIWECTTLPHNGCRPPKYRRT